MTDEVTLYRALAGNDPLKVADPKQYGAQYGLYLLADDYKPKGSPGRISSLFCALFQEEARQWGEHVFEIAVDIPYKYRNAFSVEKWTELLEYWLIHREDKDQEQVMKETIKRIKAYWASVKPIREIKSSDRYEVLIDPSWVKEVKEVNQEETREFKQSFR